MRYDDMMHLERQVATVARWIGRLIALFCIFAVAGYIHGRWVV